jgi:oligopeptide/dipeptide ABC transporter ATP-binding protein
MSAHTLNLTQDNALVVVDHLRRVFPSSVNWWQQFHRQPTPETVAVNDLSLRIYRCTTVGLVGESGSGKSTAGRCIVGLLPPTSGSILFAGEDVVHRDAQSRRQLRQKMQIIFQDPYSALNPRLTAGAMLREVIAFHQPQLSYAEKQSRVLELLHQVGLNSSHLDRYPHQVSGGQRQRLGIARALAVNPEFIVCDEPVSALDVSVQSQVINLLEDLQATHGLTYLFISHNLSVVRYISREVAVMYQGQIVEQAPTEAVFHQPHHPYTQALLAAIPRLHSPTRQPSSLPATSYQPETGCAFRQRCPAALSRCIEPPPWAEVAPNHWSRCWLGR